MPISIPGRNLNLCFTKIKWPQSPQSPPRSPTPQNPDHDHNRSLPSTSTSSSLIRNFNSLYDHQTFDSTSKSLSQTSSTLSTTSSSYEPDPAAAAATPVDFASVFASQRFFFSTPGRSNSIIESTIQESTLAPINDIARPPEPEKLFSNSVAVPTYSPDPYADFRRSMQEMVEARELLDVKSNWDFLHELLLCYLALNPKNTHKFILGAFADLVVNLLSQPPAEARPRDPTSNCEISQR
ncbi:transcription repressor OFP16-like [Alnus glutinosa]|uniref:transcription repressor OFP16-like n=1 Tax=Alnus glutinosa TaxID=3517 RepID=UPI002D7911E5|nr:transcription repressor OFP16-like [Alnus glutinosa]